MLNITNVSISGNWVFKVTSAQKTFWCCSPSSPPSCCTATTHSCRSSASRSYRLSMSAWRTWSSETSLNPCPAQSQLPVSYLFLEKAATSIHCYWSGSNGRSYAQWLSWTNGTCHHGGPCQNRSPVLPQLQAANMLIGAGPV